MKMNKKGLIGVASALVAGVGVVLAYLEGKNNDEFLTDIESRLSDVEKFYGSDEVSGEVSGEEEAETETAES